MPAPPSPLAAAYARPTMAFPGLWVPAGSLAEGGAAQRERSDDEAVERGIAWIVDGARARLAARQAG